MKPNISADISEKTEPMSAVTLSRTLTAASLIITVAREIIIRKAEKKDIRIRTNLSLTREKNDIKSISLFFFGGDSRE